MGEEVCPNYYEGDESHESQDQLIYDAGEGGGAWLCYNNSNSLQLITFKELLTLIVNEQKPVEKEFKVGDSVKIIKASNGCYGAENQIGTIVSDDTKITQGLFESDNWDYKIKIGVNIWRVKGEFKEVEFVVKSTDGHDLYEGALYYSAYKANKTGEWKSQYVHNPISKTHSVVIDNKNNKAFYSILAMDQWIKEQNKPDKIRVMLPSENCYVDVFSDKCDFRIDQFGFTLLNNHLSEIDSARKALQ